MPCQAITSASCDPDLREPTGGMVELGEQGEDPIAVFAPMLLDRAHVQRIRGGVDLGKERTQGTGGKLGLDRGV